jgi:hypothetical protein
MAQDSPFPLQRLPPELRKRIYDLHFQGIKFLIQPRSSVRRMIIHARTIVDNESDLEFPPLIHASQLTRREAYDSFLTNTTFVAILTFSHPA